MKLLLISPPELFAKALAARDDLDVFCLADPAARGLFPFLDDGHFFPFATKAKVDFRAIGRIRAAMRTVRPDLVNAFYSRPVANTALATTFFSNPPPIVSVRGIERVPSLRDISEFISFLHPSVKGHACDSQAVVEAMVRGGVRRDQCEPIYFYIPDLPRFDDGRDRLAAAGVPRDAFVLGVTATIRPVKGVDVLLEAVKACGDLDRLHVALIGRIKDPKVEAQLKEPALRGRVTALGFRTDPVQLASGLDLFVMPSRTEALCRALLEAMSQETCPIVSDAGGMKELVRHEQDGLVVPKDNVAALANAIRRVYHDDALRRQFAASSLARARCEFTPARMAERALNLYRRVLNAPCRRVAA